LLTDEERIAAALLNAQHPLTFNELRTETAASGPAQLHKNTMRKCLNRLVKQKFVKEDKAKHRGQRNHITITENGKQHFIQVLSADINEALKLIKETVMQIERNPSIARKFTEAARRKIIDAKDREERFEAAFQLHRTLFLVAKQLHELILHLEVGNGFLPLENRLLIFDHAHNVLHITDKTEGHLYEIIKTLKKLKFITGEGIDMERVVINELELAVVIDALELEFENVIPDYDNPAAQRNYETHKNVYERLLKLQNSLRK
jgi:DNA-binding PadR family transcriptional regulator